MEAHIVVLHTRAPEPHQIPTPRTCIPPRRLVNLVIDLILKSDKQLVSSFIVENDHGQPPRLCRPLKEQVLYLLAYL